MNGMFNKNAKGLIFFYIILASLSGCFINPRLSEWAENYLYIDGDYGYDIDTILQTIADGEIGQESFWGYKPSEDDDSQPPTLFWDQDENLSLAEGFHQWYTDDSPEKWSLLEVEFVTNCEKMRELSGDPSSPIDWGKVIVFYYKPSVNLNYGIPNRQVHKIIFSPNFETIFISEWIYNPIPFISAVEIPELGSLDTTEMKIKVEAAYRIAEKAGGNKYDQCTIVARNSLEDEYDGWYIYFLDNLGESFDIIINDQTGDYEIIND